MVEKYKTIVIADKDKNNLAAVKNALKDSYIILTVTSTKTLFLLLETIEPDLILLDAELDDLNGTEIIFALNRPERTSKIPVIIMSNKSYSITKKEEINLGAVGWIKKPFTGALLKRRLGRYFITSDQQKMK